MTTPRIEEQWQNKFLNKGTELSCGDLSIMIGTVSEILAQAKEEAHQAGMDEAVRGLSTAKRWRKMLEGLGRGFAIYITPEEKELLLLSLREVDSLKKARQQALDDTIKALQDNK